MIDGARMRREASTRDSVDEDVGAGAGRRPSPPDPGVERRVSPTLAARVDPLAAVAAAGAVALTGASVAAFLRPGFRSGR